MDREEPGLLYVAILREKAASALFLLENGADYKKRSELIDDTWSFSQDPINAAVLAIFSTPLNTLNLLWMPY